MFEAEGRWPQQQYVPIGLNSNFRFYKYEPGDRFGMHVDESVQVQVEEMELMARAPVGSCSSDDKEAKGAANTKEESAFTMWTLLVYLNGGRPDEGLEGGQTCFYTGFTPKKAKLAASVDPLVGRCLAHIHGSRCMLHEGAEVSKGVKYLMRTDVVFQALDS